MNFPWQHLQIKTKRSHQHLYLPGVSAVLLTRFNCKTGVLTALIVPGPGKLCCLFGRDNEYVIPWDCICQIGDDIILVEIDEEKCFHKN